MGKQLESISKNLQDFIEKQQMFFVATAATAGGEQTDQCARKKVNACLFHQGSALIQIGRTVGAVYKNLA